MLRAMIKRNSLLYFKDKGAFFASMITPMILLVLYVTFLSNVYRDNLVSSIPVAFMPDEAVLDALYGAENFLQRQSQLH